MKIKIEMEIENCYDCPFKIRVYEQGYCATDCAKLPPYHKIADKGLRLDCPFLSQQKNKNIE